jgi:hypothetical protein
MKLIIGCLALFFTSNINAQNVHVGAKFGLGSYKGDLKPNGGLGQSSIAWSIGAKYDISEHLIGRAFFNRTKLKGDDAKKNNARNLNFEAKLNEVELGIQYQIFSLNEKWWTPYVFVGGSIYGAKAYTMLGGKKVFLQPLSTEGQGFAPGKPTYKSTKLAFVYGLGGEYALGEDLRVGLELGLRYTGNDYIDDVSDVYVDGTQLLTNKGATAVALAYRGGGTYPTAGTARGNNSNKDNFYYLQLTVTFRPFVNQWKRTSGIAGMKKEKRVGCPQTKGIF